MSVEEIQQSYEQKDHAQMDTLYRKWLRWDPKLQWTRGLEGIFLKWMYMTGQRKEAHQLLQDILRVKKQWLSESKKQKLLYRALHFEFLNQNYKYIGYVLEEWKPMLMNRHNGKLPFGYIYWRLVSFYLSDPSPEKLLQFIWQHQTYIEPPYFPRWAMLCGLFLCGRGLSEQGIPYFILCYRGSPVPFQWKAILSHCRQWRTCPPPSPEQFFSLIQCGRQQTPIASQHLFDAVYVDYLLSSGLYMDAERYSLAYLFTCPGQIIRHLEILFATLQHQKKFDTSYQLIAQNEKEPKFHQNYALWQVRQLILLAQFKEEKQVEFIGTLLRSKWKDNVTVLCGILNFYLNPTNKNFNLTKSEFIWQVILARFQDARGIHNGDVAVFGIRLYLIKSMLSSVIEAEKEGLPPVNPCAPGNMTDWIHRCKNGQPSTGYYFTMFALGYEDFPHIIIDRIFYETVQELKLYQSLFVQAYRRSHLKSEFMSTSSNIFERYRERSRFGDYYPYIPTSSKMFHIGKV